jgi:hypothetical protein
MRRHFLGMLERAAVGKDRQLFRWHGRCDFRSGPRCNVYRSWVGERATRGLRRRVHVLVSSTSAASSTSEAEGIQASMIVAEVESIGSSSEGASPSPYCKGASYFRCWLT